MGRSLIATLLIAGLATSVLAGPPQRPLTNPKFDPNAKQVELFEAMKDGSVEAKMIPKDSLGGNLLITNKTNEPLTVQIPDGFVGVPMNAQFGGGGFGQGGGGFGGGGQLGGGGGQGGQNQAVGGGAGGGGGLGGGGGQFGGGGGQQGFFSIPADRTLLVPYKSVCLEHGKHEPSVRTTYAVVPVEQYTENPVLRKLIPMVGSGRIDQGSAQAAAWNVANGMPWDQLANKKFDHIGAPDSPYFSPAQLMQAQQVVAAAEYAAKNDPAPEQAKPQIRQTERTAR